MERLDCGVIERRAHGELAVIPDVTLNFSELTVNQSGDLILDCGETGDIDEHRAMGCPLAAQIPNGGGNDKGTHRLFKTDRETRYHEIGFVLVREDRLRIPNGAQDGKLRIIAKESLRTHVVRRSFQAIDE